MSKPAYPIARCTHCSADYPQGLPWKELHTKIEQHRQECIPTRYPSNLRATREHESQHFPTGRPG